MKKIIMLFAVVFMTVRAKAENIVSSDKKLLTHEQSELYSNSLDLVAKSLYNVATFKHQENMSMQFSVLIDKTIEECYLFVKNGTTYNLYHIDDEGNKHAVIQGPEEDSSDWPTARNSRSW